MMSIDDLVVFIESSLEKTLMRQTNSPQVEIPAYSDMLFFIPLPTSAIF
jgi:hypothetical protein